MTTTSRRNVLAGLAAMATGSAIVDDFIAPTAAQAQDVAEGRFDILFVGRPHFDNPDADKRQLITHRLDAFVRHNGEILYYGSMCDNGAFANVVYFDAQEVADFQKDAADWSYYHPVTQPGWYIGTVVEGQVWSTGDDYIKVDSAADAIDILRTQVQIAFANNDFGYFDFRTDPAQELHRAFDAQV